MIKHELFVIHSKKKVKIKKGTQTIYFYFPTIFKRRKDVKIKKNGARDVSRKESENV